MQTKIIAVWENIKQKCDAQTLKTQMRENKGLIEHNYQPGGTVLILCDLDKYVSKLDSPTESPFESLSVKTDGALKIQRGGYSNIAEDRGAAMTSYPTP